MSKLDKTIIGRYEYVDFKDFEELNMVPAKIDTGAYSSSIHTSSAKVVKIDNEDVLTFKLFGHSIYPNEELHKVKTFKQIHVRNSFGKNEERYLVRMTIQLKGKTFKTYFTLANRASSTFPVLIGRRTLSTKFLVDPDKSVISRAELREKYNVDIPAVEEDD